jgi:hypothetical protein
MVHLNYATRREFLAKQRAYTRLRIQSTHTPEIPRRRAYLGAPLRELHRRLVAHRGYRDGATGLFLALVLAFEEARFVFHARRSMKS